MKLNPTIPGLLLVMAAGCTLLKSNRETSSTNSAPVVARSTPASTPVTTNAGESESHPDDTASGGATQNDELHTPAKGTDERQAIMDALRGNQQVVFQVNYLKVHNGWCWVDTTPL